MIKVLHYITLVTGLLFFIQTKSSGQNLDSLLSLVNASANDSLKVQCIINLVYFVSSSDHDTAVYYANEGLKICTEQDFPKMEFTLLWLKGVTLLEGSNFTQAQKTLIKAETLANKNGDFHDICKVNNSLGSIHKELSALSNYDTSENRTAQKYFQTALDYALLNNDSIEIARGYNNVGITYMVQADYEKGMTMWQNSLDIKLALGNELSASRTMGNMAMYYRDTKEYKKAYDIYMKIIKIQKKHNYRLGIFRAYTNLGELFEQKKDYKKSLEYYRLSLSISQSINSLHNESLSFKRLSKIFAFINQFDSAYIYLASHINIKDTIFTIEEQKIITEAQEKFESKKRQHLIELLKKDKETEKLKQEGKDKFNLIRTTALVTSIVGLFIILLLVLFILRIRSVKNKALNIKVKKIEAQKAERETLLKEVHHRVKNNLQVITGLLSLQSSYIENSSIKEMFNQSQYRINSMAMVHEMLYKSENLSQIKFNAYLMSLVNFLVLSTKGNNNNIKLNIDILDVALRISTAVPLGLMVNEILTNALSHGIKGEEEGEITIKLEKNSSSRYSLTIGDNGVGCPDNITFNNSPSLGLRLMYKLARQLNGSIEKIPSLKGCHYKIDFEETE